MEGVHLMGGSRNRGFTVCEVNVVATSWQDSSLIITGSADKNIKIWGLDYGDCHKSIFGHDDR